LIFDGDSGSTILRSNEIVLTAGPGFELTNPPVGKGGEREPIDPALLPAIDFSGLAEIGLSGDPKDSFFGVRQSGPLDLAEDGNGAGGPDLLAALEAGAIPERWDSIQLSSVQSDVFVDGLEVLADVTEDLFVDTGPEGSVEVHVPDQAISAAPFDDFVGSVEIDSNDISFQTSDPATSINVASEKLRLVSDRFLTTTDSEEDVFEVRNEGDPDRPIVRIRQVADFTDSQIPRPTQYYVRQLTVGIDPVEEVVPRESLAGLDIQLHSEGSTLTFDESLRDRVTTANLILESTLGDVVFDITSPTPGYEEIEAASVQLSSLLVRAAGGLGTIQIDPFDAGSPESPLTLRTTGEQRFEGSLALGGSLATWGQDLIFGGNVRVTDSEAGLLVLSAGSTVFEGEEVGDALNPLARLSILFDGGAEGTPNVQFGRRIDDDNDNGLDDSVDLENDPLLEEIGDEFAETPLPSNQEVWVRDDIVIGAVDVQYDNEVVVGRQRSALVATVGKALGDLTFHSLQGDFVMGPGEKLSVGGTARVEVGPGGVATLGDLAAIRLEVIADEIELVRRKDGVYYDRFGQTQSDAGPSITTNSLDFGGVVPTVVGVNRAPYFGFPDPFAPPIAPGNEDVDRFLRGFSAFAITPDARPLGTADFVFAVSNSQLVSEVPLLPPIGASRSDLSGAYGPVQLPTPTLVVLEPVALTEVDRLWELDVEPYPTPPSVLRARLLGGAIIDDIALAHVPGFTPVTEARLDAKDTEAAIALYSQIFGPDGERADHVRDVLQDALDLYLENTRARRVIGFELRRFVKNRPSTLFEAYQTLEELEQLFRYHRRLGLSPGEYRPVQLDWLREIQPDGITLDELSEAIHPSRYVRGSDILDIFGQ
jgi:hypothetical protein